MLQFFFDNHLILFLEWLFILELDMNLPVICSSETDPDQSIQHPRFATKSSFTEKQSSVSRVNSTDSNMSFTKVARTSSSNYAEVGQAPTFSSQQDVVDENIYSRQSRINTITSDYALSADNNDTIAERSETSCSAEGGPDHESGLCLLFLTGDGSLWSVPSFDKQFLKLGLYN